MILEHFHYSIIPLTLPRLILTIIEWFMLKMVFGRKEITLFISYLCFLSLYTNPNETKCAVAIVRTETNF